MKKPLSMFVVVTGIAGLAYAGDAGMGKSSDMPSQSTAKPEFQAVDTDRDGKLSKSELKAIPETDFAKADINRDGMLDRTEFRNMAWMPGSPKHGALQSSAKPEFDDVDSNDDGKLSKPEAASKLEGVDFATLDLNKNGYIERGEYRSAPAMLPRKGAQDPASQDSSHDPMNLE